jgi:hypothetical protein
MSHSKNHKNLDGNKNDNKVDLEPLNENIWAPPEKDGFPSKFWTKEDLKREFDKIFGYNEKPKDSEHKPDHDNVKNLEKNEF